MRVVIVANPVAGSGRVQRRLQGLMREWPFPDWEPDLRWTRRAGDAGRIAVSLTRDPPHCLAICGGDGSMNEVATALPEPPFPVGLIPAGTGNVLARDLGLPLDMRGALRIALGGRQRRVDLGEVCGDRERRFILMAGAGFDARVVQNVTPAAKRRFGRAAFVTGALRCLAEYRLPRFRVRTETAEIESVSCVIANSRGYGGGICLAPQADMEDGLLDVVAILPCSRTGLARFALSAWLGLPGDFPFVHRLRTPAVRLEGPHEVLSQVDGELFGSLPLEIGLRPRAFRLAIPWERPAG